MTLWRGVGWGGSLLVGTGANLLASLANVTITHWDRVLTPLAALRVGALGRGGGVAGRGHALGAQQRVPVPALVRPLPRALRTCHTLPIHTPTFATSDILSAHPCLSVFRSTSRGAPPSPRPRRRVEGWQGEPPPTASRVVSSTEIRVQGAAG